MAKFLVDADMPARTAQVLRDSGHDATDVRELGLGSAADQAIFDRAQREGRVVVSRDLGFANLASRSAEHNGVLLLRFGGIRSSSIISGLLAALTSQDAAAANFSNTVVVLEPGRIRTRRIP